MPPVASDRIKYLTEKAGGDATYRKIKKKEKSRRRKTRLKILCDEQKREIFSGGLQDLLVGVPHLFNVNNHLLLKFISVGKQNGIPHPSLLYIYVYTYKKKARDTNGHLYFSLKGCKKLLFLFAYFPFFVEDVTQFCACGYKEIF